MAAPGTTQLTDFQRTVLGWLFDDYESPGSLANDIAREIDRPVTEAEVAGALRVLVQKGLVAAFRYDKQAEEFERIDLGSNISAEGLWYLALPRGRTEIDQAAI